MLQHSVTTNMLWDSPPLQYGLSEWLSHGGVAVAAMTTHQACYICDGGCCSNYMRFIDFKS